MSLWRKIEEYILNHQILLWKFFRNIPTKAVCDGITITIKQ